MSHIFDDFPSRAKADSFAVHIEQSTGRSAEVYDERRDDLDPFPYELTPPVVYVDRHDVEPDGTDDVLTDAASRFGGRYAGT